MTDRDKTIWYAMFQIYTLPDSNERGGDEAHHHNWTVSVVRRPIRSLHSIIQPSFLPFPRNVPLKPMALGTGTLLRMWGER